MAAPVSHGRGGKHLSKLNTCSTNNQGAANIRPDDTPYTDGEIVREGPVGDQGDGTYSSGRGGRGNIGADLQPGQQVGDADYIPETATREIKDENYHYGRGGAGNEIHHDKKEKTVDQHGFQVKVPQDSLKDKVKHIFHK